MRRITSKPWFGPKQYIDWGWRVTSWQGAVILALFIGLLLIDLIYTHTTVVSITGALLLTLSFVFIALLTGDPPGNSNY